MSVMPRAISAKTCIIALTSRRPAIISEAAWPIVSDVVGDDEDGHSRLTVRQHADGRSIVYAVRLSNGVDGYVVRKGEVAGNDNVVEAICRVADCCGVRSLADECIEGMPPVSLD